MARRRPRVVVLRREIPPLQQVVEPPRRTPPQVNPAQYALHETFSPRHAAEEQVAFRPVGQEGIVTQQTEEWFRDGNSMRSRVRHTKVVTVSGEIVTADKIKGRCWCRGYDDVIARCEWCGCALCRLHVRTFTGPDGQRILCDRHYHQALNQFNTWDALDRSRKGK